MIYIGLGANLDSPKYGPPLNTLMAALDVINTCDCTVIRRSPWYKSASVPDPTLPWFVNGVAELNSMLAPDELLARLHAVEDQFDRIRTVPNAPRTLDLDLLVYNDVVSTGSEKAIVPHPRMQDRAFVLLPLKDLAPDWIDPRNGLTLKALIDKLPDDQPCYPLAEA